MLKIKLARFGRRGQPHFRIVVNEARSKRDGQYMALLGQYVPAQQPKILEIDVKAFDEWLKKGAQPTETVAALYKRFKSKDPFPARKPQPSKKQLAKKADQEKAKTEAKAEAPAEVKTTEVETKDTDKPATAEVKSSEAEAKSETQPAVADTKPAETPETQPAVAETTPEAPQTPPTTK